MISFICNNELVSTDCSTGLPLLDWIRSQHGIKGTKEGCREGDCGACTVLLGKQVSGGMVYSALCSCLLPTGEANGCHLVTIEGLTTEDELTPFQNSFYNEAASQCGFCTPGMIMSLTGCLLSSQELTVSAAMESLGGNICRCTGYVAVKRAVEDVMNSFPSRYANRLEMLISRGHVPDYFRTVPDRLKLLPQLVSQGQGALIAGGTDMYVHSSDESVTADPVLLSGRKDLDFITIEGEFVKIGALVTTEQLRTSRDINRFFPELNEYLLRVSSTQIRNRATVGGNLVNASPVADLAILFLALNSTVFLSGGGAVPLHNFYLGYKKLALNPGEMLTHLSFPVPEKDAILSMLKVCKREYLDIASVNSALLIRTGNGCISSARLSAGGVAPFPLLLERTASFLCGKPLNRKTIKDACRIASLEVSPISDIRGSSEYKRELLGAEIMAHLTRLEAL